MKHKRIASFFVAGSATMFQIAVPIPGCDSMVLDPQAFFGDNTCNIFNCDTLFFLQEDHAVDEHDEMTEALDVQDVMDMAESENHTEG